MNRKLLLKGFEVELFTGRETGENVGVAADVAKDLEGFVTEPDQRNLEYITAPEKEYALLKEALISPRRELRQWLSPRGLTLLPGSTLSLGDSKKFERSDPENLYHEYIECNYGTSIVTSSVHINFGIENLDKLFPAVRLVRCEAALLLAISASSPFLDGVLTGCHSQRWLQFPLTPKSVPLFRDHSHYVQWIEEHLNSGIMKNERHLWTSVRPNGPQRPYILNRLELRICDLVTDSDLLLAITALLELRLLNLFEDINKIDPFKTSDLSLKDLARLSNMNDSAAAQDSLDAKLHHWMDGQPILCRNWIENLLEEVMPLAKELNMFHLLSPINAVLDKGNQAMQWKDSFEKGLSVKDIIQSSIIEMRNEEDFQIKTDDKLV